MKIKKNENYVVVYNDNWADEMDLDGFFTCTGKELKELKKTLLKSKKSANIGIGSNEDIEYSNGKELWNCLTYHKISERENQTIERIFGGTFGFADVVNRYLEYTAEEDDDVENDDENK